MGRRIETLVECRSARGSLDPETARWLENAPPALKVRLADVGIIDGARVSAAKPLAELLRDFTGHLEAKERTAKYVGECEVMLRRVFDECGFVVWSDITPGKVEGYLKGLRDGGLSVRRSNGYLTALKGFIRWMIDTAQASESPLRGLRKLNEKIDVRRERRAATPDELRKLIATTAASGELFGMGGGERSLLYRFCAETGLRANEARSLTAGDFDLDGLTVRVRAGYSKHRETDTVPLREELAEALRGHLSGKLPTGKVFRRHLQQIDRQDGGNAPAGP
jgi:integrase